MTSSKLKTISATLRSTRELSGAWRRPIRNANNMIPMKPNTTGLTGVVRTRRRWPVIHWSRYTPKNPARTPSSRVGVTPN